MVTREIRAIVGKKVSLVCLYDASSLRRLVVDDFPAIVRFLIRPNEHG